MSAISPTAGEPLLQEPPDFSLVLGGPLYQLWRRSRLAGDTLESAAPPHRDPGAAGLGAAAALVGRGRARLGRECTAAFSLRHRHPCAPAARAAAVDPGGTDRPPADARRGGAIPVARPDPGRGASEVRRGHHVGHALAQFRRGGGVHNRVRLCRGRRLHLAHPFRARRDELAWRRRRWKITAVARRLVAGLREPADLPIPAPALVFPAVRVGAFPVAGVAP